MKPFIDIENFVKFFNQAKIQFRTNEVVTINISNIDFSASLIMRSQHDYKENYTIEFVLKFDHKKHSREGYIFQREFTIEHHPEQKSSHTKPHVQLHIHGPSPKEKVGELWITLPLKTEKEYTACIEGFLLILKKVINICEPGLEKFMLNTREIEKLARQKDFLIQKITESLVANGIEYENPEGKKTFLSPQNINSIVTKDQTLLPFFP
jgi:hypothetical protein